MKLDDKPTQRGKKEKAQEIETYKRGKRNIKTFLFYLSLFKTI